MGDVVGNHTEQIVAATTAHQVALHHFGKGLDAALKTLKLIVHLGFEIHRDKYVNRQSHGVLIHLGGIALDNALGFQITQSAQARGL